MSFGSKFKQARENMNLSQQEIANILNVTDGTISNYEKGVAFPRWDTTRKLCDILNVDPNYLFWDDLSDNIKEKIITEKSHSNKDTTILLYNQLDTEDKAEIKGEIKQMLKASKYNNTSNVETAVTDDIATEIKTALVKSKI